MKTTLTKILKLPRFDDPLNRSIAPILISSMGRSGSTWLSQFINYREDMKELFEPFLPCRVPEVSFFEYCQYLPSDFNDVRFKEATQKVISGEINNEWVNGEPLTKQYNRVLIKDIRTNLMLDWLHVNFANLKIILLVRNPYSVISSWKRLGWGVEPEGKRRDLDIILSQERLLSDFPVVDKAIERFDKEDYVTELAILWSVLYHVPLRSTYVKNFHLARYESLLEKPKEILPSLFEHIECPYQYSNISKKIKITSKTSCGRNKFRANDDDLKPAEKKKIKEVISFFGLDQLYDPDDL